MSSLPIIQHNNSIELPSPSLLVGGIFLEAVEQFRVNRIHGCLELFSCWFYDIIGTYFGSRVGSELIGLSDSADQEGLFVRTFLLAQG
jgi:CDP-diglyceride synthetase